jgi:hypothetical protein
MNELLQEFCDSRGVPMRVDRQAGVIRGVKILGLQSRNGRQYLPEALAKAVPLYEGAKVNVNHPKGGPLSPRDYQDRIGVIRGAVLKPNEGLFGDLHFNPKHVLAEQLAWDAEHAPENVGFSHNVQARTSRRDDGLLVEEITRVQSVDLVADPATTRGLYEQNQSTTAESLPAAALPIAGLTLERLKTERPDLVESLLLEQRARPAAGAQEIAYQAELQQLRSELDQLRSQRDMALLEQHIAEELSAAGVAEPLVTELFRQQLRSTPDAALRRKLILERLQLARTLGSARPTSKDQQLVESGALPWSPGDPKSFAQRITCLS